jgi:RpiB/LacA/LacB family sugar-phosphate isomerase
LAAVRESCAVERETVPACLNLTQESPVACRIMMAANKVKGIRCGVCADTFSARMIRQHKDANMLSLGSRVIGEGLASEIVDAFLSSEFEGGIIEYVV